MLGNITVRVEGNYVWIKKQEKEDTDLSDPENRK